MHANGKPVTTKKAKRKRRQTQAEADAAIAAFNEKWDHCRRNATAELILHWNEMAALLEWIDGEVDALYKESREKGSLIEGTLYSGDIQEIGIDLGNLLSIFRAAAPRHGPREKLRTPEKLARLLGWGD